MATGQASLKVAGGKLIRVHVWWEETIEKILITGDFFLHPEETLAEIEQRLIGVRASEREDALTRLVEQVLNERNAHLYGIEARDIAHVVKEAIRCGGL